MKKLNIVFSVVLIAVAAFFFFYADTFKMLPGQTEIGPGAFPKAVCVGLAVCGVLLIIQELRKGGSEKAELFSKKLLIGIATAVAYFVLLKILGFVLDSIWVVFVMMACCSTSRSKRRDAAAALYLWHGPRGRYFHAAGHLLRRDLRRLHHRHPDRHTRHAGLGRHYPSAPNS